MLYNNSSSTIEGDSYAKIKVLMIDDNVKLVDAVKEYFKDNDEIDIVLSAYDGLEGFEVITNKINEYDVIVLDLIMPKKMAFIF